MPMYKVDVTILDEIAEFFLCLGGEPSHWYIINDGHFDDICHFSSRLGIKDPDDYQKLLITAGLASFRSGNCQILSNEWVNLRGHHRITASKIPSTELFEVTSFKIRGPNNKRYDIYAIRIGPRSSDSANTLGMQRQRNILPPRPSNTFRLHQEAFRRSTAVAIEHTRMDMLCNEPCAEGERVTTTPGRKSREVSDATIITPSGPSARDENIVATCAINNTNKNSPSPVNNTNDEAATTIGKQMYPILSSLFQKFDPYDDKVQKLLRPLLSEVLHLLDASKEGLKVHDIGGHEVSYLRIPRASSDQSFNNSKTWVDDALSLNHGPNESTFESALRVIIHLMRFYNDSFVEALKRRGIAIAQPMTTTQYVAMLSALSTSGKKEQELAKYLRHHLGKSFIPTRKDVWMLAEGHVSVEAHSKQWQYEDGKRAEKVHWSEKDINKEIEIQLARELKANAVKPSDVLAIRAAVGGDFGDTAFQFVAEVTAVTNSKRIKFQSIISELVCKTDSAALLEATILPNLQKGLKFVCDTHLHIYTTDDGSLLCSFESPTPTSFTECVSLPVEIFFIGDLAFQAIALGRDGMSGQHCMMCQLSRTQMNNGRDEGEPWTIPLLLEIGTEAIRKGKAIAGIKQTPWFPFINFKHYMVPLLHVEIGIGNNLLNKFCDTVNVYIERKCDKEIELTRQLTVYEQVIIDTVKERDVFDADRTKGKRLKSLQGKIARLQKKQQTNTNNNNDDDDDEDEYEDDDDADAFDDDNNEDGAAANDKQQAADIAINDGPIPMIEKYEAELKPLLIERNALAEKLKQTRRCVSEKNKILLELQNTKKKSFESLDTKIFEVLKEVRVELAAYHGGSLTGKDIRKVMNNATYLFDKFTTILKEGKWENSEYSDADINELCRRFKLSFELWDGAFSLARKHNPDPEDAALYQRFVDAAFAMHKRNEMRITPKVHLMHKHVRWQMENIIGGIGDKVEDGIEMSHQTGRRRRGQFSSVVDLQVKAVATQRVVHRNSDPAVVRENMKVNAASKRKFTERNDAEKAVAEENREQERKEKRMTTLEYYESLQEERNEQILLTSSISLMPSDGDGPERQMPPPSGPARRTQPEGATLTNNKAIIFPHHKRESIQCADCEGGEVLNDSII